MIGKDMASYLNKIKKKLLDRNIDNVVRLFSQNWTLTLSAEK